ncbi:hypothetical protein BO78DRAFT_384539 [Aspergillus sclerotiicarbonarius CBS 121057]|uniref:Uncharacterized protein n=1 Tax=Aspergillus sclerotiicarbonarius (strain CBS 121057 / IBT 28362) TaxID=1448318 RepID=A0A319EFR3_ASPSB|nr:hypothetical protein BO78DRAFT_384539 [Aspergillus sclerotiicarbonarius CBS 121057]
MDNGDLLATRIATFKKCDQLLQIINVVKVHHVGVDELRHIGIRAVRVEPTEDQLLPFDPCYFDPLEVGVLSKYPFSQGWREYDLDEGYSYQSILARILQVAPGAKKPEELAQKSSHLCGYRSGIPGNVVNGTLEDLTPLRRNEDELERVTVYSTQLMETSSPGATNWRFLYVLEDPDAELPHTIAFFWNFEISNDEDLTTSEVRGIVRWMVWMFHRPLLRYHRMFPFLSIWYLGPKHVRIIQSHFDGETIVLQYSPLLSFENRQTAPTELVVRYGASRPVPLETKPDGPSQIEEVADAT